MGTGGKDEETKGETLEQLISNFRFQIEDFKSEI